MFMSISYDMYKNDPVTLYLNILYSLALTILIYSPIPIILATTRRKTITKRKYRWQCNGYNAIGLVIFSVLSSPASASPYALWTWVFFKIGLKILDKKNLLDYSSGKVLTECISCGYINKDKFEVCPKCGGKSLHFIDAETHDPNAERPQPVILPQKESVAPQANTPHRTRIKVQRKSAHSQPLPEHQAPIGDKKPSHEKRPTKHTAVLLILSILLAGSLALNAVQFISQDKQEVTHKTERNELQKQVWDRDLTIINLNGELRSIKKDFTDLQDRLCNLQDTTVICDKTTMKFHFVSGCYTSILLKHDNDSSSFSTDIGTAIHRGYTFCDTCIKR